MTYSYSREKQYTCRACRLDAALSDREQAVIDDAPAKEKKLDVAIARIQKVGDIGKYEGAIKSVRAVLHGGRRFESTEEIMVALELERKGEDYRHQVRFGSRYRADFVLPQRQVVLEVDGVLFHGKRTREKEKLRDGLILATLGPEWEVIRISDEVINQNITRLMDAVLVIKKRRGELRGRNNGALPQWYTDREA